MSIRKQVSNKWKLLQRGKQKKASQVNNFIADHIVKNVMWCETRFI